MLFHLIKKDFLIVKKYVLLMLLVSIFIPLFVLWRVPELGGETGFVLSAIFAVFMLLQYVSMKEYQYPKVSALLCSTPYPRKTLVLSKYGFCILVYIFCCIIYWIESFLFPGLGKLNINLISTMLLLVSIFIGIYLPVQFKLGYEKTKFVFVIIIMASPFLLPQLTKINGGISLSIIQSVSPMLLSSLIALISILITLVSAFISIKIFDNVDLI